MDIQPECELRQTIAKVMFHNMSQGPLIKVGCENSCHIRGPTTRHATSSGPTKVPGSRALQPAAYYFFSKTKLL
eukprot:1141396-Pelagomonas_calceolata.AAC.7